MRCQLLGSFQLLLELPRGRSGILSRGYRTDDDGTPRARLTDRIQPLPRRDTADREPRFGRLGGGCGQQRCPHRGAAWLRRGLPDRPYTEIVGLRVCLGGERLLEGMGRAAEDDIGSEHSPGLSTGEVALTDVEDVGVGQQRNVGTVID